MNTVLPIAQDRLPRQPQPTRTAKIAVRTAVAACGGLAAYCTNPVLAGAVTVVVSMPGVALLGAGYGVIHAIDALYKNNVAVAACTAAASGFFSWFAYKGDFTFGIADRLGY